MSPTARLTLGSLLMAALVVLSPFAVARADCGAGGSAPTCRVHELDPGPRWMFHGQWLNEGEELVLADVLGGRLLRYDRSGRSLGAVSRPGRGLEEFDRPFKLIDTGKELFLIDRADHLVTLDRQLEPTKGIGLRDLRLPGGTTILLMWADVAFDGSLVGLSGTRNGADPWWGLGRLTIGATPRFERVVDLPPQGTPGGDAYSVLGPVVAVAGGRAFALRLDGRPHIQKILPERRRLQAFPAGYLHGPVLPASRGPEGAEERYRAMEGLTAPVALYSRGSFLYLLTRKPGRDGSTNWTLHQIDPERDRLIRSVALPTHANHLVVVPGPIDWALVEKGPVGPAAQQKIGPVILVPSPWIETPEGTGAISCASDRGR